MFKWNINQRLDNLRTSRKYWKNTPEFHLKLSPFTRWAPNQTGITWTNGRVINNNKQWCASCYRSQAKQSFLISGDVLSSLPCFRRRAASSPSPFLRSPLPRSPPDSHVISLLLQNLQDQIQNLYNLLFALPLCSLPVHLVLEQLVAPRVCLFPSRGAVTCKLDFKCFLTEN